MSEGFFSRWSRRKREIGGGVAKTPAADGAASPGEVQGAEARDPLLSAGRTARSEPAVDLSKLPSIESIGAATDIRVFLAPGVPMELRRAALRRAWAVDPAIRDFIGLAENQWDFVAANAPGFGPLTGDELRRALVELLGEAPSQAEATPEAAQRESAGEGTCAEARPTALGLPTPGEDPAHIVRRTNEIAAVPNGSAQPSPRRHGGALPE